MESILLRARGEEDSRSFSSARRRGVYGSLEQALQRAPEEIVEEVKRSNLRGRGGAGFPTGLKWQFTHEATAPQKYVICNADESEPGTFKDREVIRTDPHLLIEGIAIAAYAVGASAAVIYIRGEFPEEARILDAAIGEAIAQGMLRHAAPDREFKLDLWVHRGAGAYICGEETALLNSLEGRRGAPRVRPPFPAVSGFLSSPTVVNNVETLSCVPSIIAHGSAWFSKIGRPRNAGPKLYSVSGHVARPGVYELPMGTPFREIIYDHCGGLLNGGSLKAFIPGGVATPVLPADKLDVHADYDSVAEAGSHLGSGGLIVMDQSTCMVDAARTCLEFMIHESCGKCSSCRIGTRVLLDLVGELQTARGNEVILDRIERLGRHVKQASLCGLGQSAPNVLLSAMSHFRSEFQAHAAGAECTACAGQHGAGS
jgi:NADH-quinone oxidoreductase subunit F